MALPLQPSPWAERAERRLRLQASLLSPKVQDPCFPPS